MISPDRVSIILTIQDGAQGDTDLTTTNSVHDPKLLFCRFRLAMVTRPSGWKQAVLLEAGDPLGPQIL
jgi:hypothetical protein